MLRAPLPLMLLLLLLLAGTQWRSAQALKLKFETQECLTLDVSGISLDVIDGSFVALEDEHGGRAEYDLTVFSPSRRPLLELRSKAEDKFSMVPTEGGRHQFCLSVAAHHQRHHTGHVAWDLRTGHHDHGHASQGDTKALWHQIDQVDVQLQQVRARQSYSFWRTRSHRKTVESTNRRVLVWAVIRSCSLVAASVGQVLALHFLFDDRGFPGMGRMGLGGGVKGPGMAF